MLVTEHVQIPELVESREETEQATKLAQEYNTRIHSLENTLKEKNYKLLTYNATTLLESTSTDLIDQLSTVMDDMIFNDAKLNLVKEELRKHKEEIEALKKVGQKGNSLVLDLQSTKDKM